MAALEDEHWWYRARRSILERAVERFVGKTDLQQQARVLLARREVIGELSQSAAEQGQSLVQLDIVLEQLAGNSPGFFGFAARFSKPILT